MTTIMPQSELLKKAVQFVNEHIAEKGETVSQAVEKASMSFNLGPKDAEYLTKLFTTAK